MDLTDVTYTLEQLIVRKKQYYTKAEKKKECTSSWTGDFRKKEGNPDSEESEASSAHWVENSRNSAWRKVNQPNWGRGPRTGSAYTWKTQVFQNRSSTGGHQRSKDPTKPISNPPTSVCETLVSTENPPGAAHRSDLFPLLNVVFCLFSVSLLKPEHTWNPAAD